MVEIFIPLRVKYALAYVGVFNCAMINEAFFFFNTLKEAVSAF